MRSYVNKLTSHVSVLFGILFLLSNVSCKAEQKSRSNIPDEINQVLTTFVTCLKSVDEDPQFQRICGAIVAWLPSDLPALKSCLVERKIIEIVENQGALKGSSSTTLTLSCKDKRVVDIVIQRQSGKLFVDRIVQIINETE